MEFSKRKIFNSLRSLSFTLGLFTLSILLSCSKVVMVANQTEEQLKDNKQGLKVLTQNELKELSNLIPKRARVSKTRPRHILIYNYTPAHWHDIAIVWGSSAIELMGKKTGAFTTTVSHDPEIFSNENLYIYAMCVINTHGILEYTWNNFFCTKSL